MSSVICAYVSCGKSPSFSLCSNCLTMRPSRRLHNEAILGLSASRSLSLPNATRTDGNTREPSTATGRSCSMSHTCTTASSCGASQRTSEDDTNQRPSLLAAMMSIGLLPTSRLPNTDRSTCDTSMISALSCGPDAATASPVSPSRMTESIRAYPVRRRCTTCPLAASTSRISPLVRPATTRASSSAATEVTAAPPDTATTA